MTQHRRRIALGAPSMTADSAVRPEPLGDAIDATRRAATQESRAYAGSEDRPLAAFAGLMAAYGALTAGLAIAAGRRGLPRRVPASDLILLGVATAKLS